MKCSVFSVQPWKIHQTMNDNNLSFLLGIRCRCMVSIIYSFVYSMFRLCILCDGFLVQCSAADVMIFRWKFPCLRLWLVIFLYFGIINVESSRCYDDDNGAHILYLLYSHSFLSVSEICIFFILHIRLSTLYNVLSTNNSSEHLLFLILCFVLVHYLVVFLHSLLSVWVYLQW